MRRRYLGVSAYKYDLCKWSIPSLPATPKHPHTLSEDLIQLVLDIRDQLKRCAEVVWYHINSVGFNRTIQEECTGNYYLESEPLKTMDDKILSYIDYYNYHRVHLSISYRTPAEMLHRL